MRSFRCPAPNRHLFIPGIIIPKDSVVFTPVAKRFPLRCLSYKAIWALSLQALPECNDRRFFMYMYLIYIISTCIYVGYTLAFMTSIRIKLVVLKRCLKQTRVVVKV
ncbi:uncharacterized protein EV154DRAFT_479435 [Mucor mucedo]|uniref:uncharacterized protein n=1 Tax=Mucor mucedo TaxID=29922 RepID=UPI00221EFD16|nr:uncharacterized protein EV154DRAFT_479435 [Mucor mucedo]KAI7893431.1 hypothetical protein EV154DRAFT_479435 [Mucor mucedo]